MPITPSSKLSRPVGKRECAAEYCAGCMLEKDELERIGAGLTGGGRARGTGGTGEYAPEGAGGGGTGRVGWLTGGGGARWWS